VRRTGSVLICLLGAYLLLTIGAAWRPRLTLAFSKKRENFEAAVALHFAYYNFVKRHSTIRCTPAMAAGVTNSFWSVGNLVEAAA